jgi:hypothetical protein
MKTDPTYPSTCPKCKTLLGIPPGWLKILACMAPGRGEDEPCMTPAMIARKSGLSRQRVALLICSALELAMLADRGDAETTLLQRTKRGKQCLNQWIVKGWRHDG